MPRPWALSIASALLAVAAVGCGSASAEEQTLLRFFVAAPTLDSTVIARYSRVAFNPRTDGIVQSFNVTSIGPENDDRKDVTIDAVLQDPAGVIRRTMMVATLQRIEGRWLVTRLRRTPVSQTSRVESSVPLK